MISLECKTEEELDEIKRRFFDCTIQIKDQKKWYGTYFVQIDIEKKKN